MTPALPPRSVGEDARLVSISPDTMKYVSEKLLVTSRGDFGPGVPIS